MAPSSIPSSDRTTELRAALVQTVETSRARRHVHPKWLIAAVSAFALAGAGTGGAISAAAAADPAVVNVNVSHMANLVVGTHATLYGTPFLLSGTGSTNVDLGARPAKASSVAIAISCVTAGTFKVRLDGRDEGSTTCTDEDVRSGHGGSGWQSAVRGSGSHELTISAGSGRFVIWASWATEAAPPAESAAQEAEMADGVVTEDEYAAAFGRFSACMIAAGYPLGSIDKSATVYNYSIDGNAVDAGVDVQCYDAEFAKVDQAWQIAHEDESQTADLLRTCLRAHGITPAEHMADIQAQLKAAGLTLEKCVAP